MAERTDIIILLDRSGSMQASRADHEGGLRSFVRDGRRLAGDVRLSFVRFDSHDPCEVVFDGRPLMEVKEEDLTLTPRGGTPLLDAVGETLTRYALRGPGTIVLVITDGQENQSRKWRKEQIQALVKEREAHGWKVLYLGANVDEFVEAGALGVAPATTLGYADTPVGRSQMYAAVTQNVGATYMARSAGANWKDALNNLTWTEEQRAQTGGTADRRAQAAGKAHPQSKNTEKDDKKEPTS